MLIRGVSGFIERRGQVVIKIVIRRDAFYLAKKWGAIAPQPPSLTPLLTWGEGGVKSHAYVIKCILYALLVSSFAVNHNHFESEISNFLSV